MKTKIAVLLFFFAALCGTSHAQVNNARMLSTPNAQTGTSYTFVAADVTRVVTFSNAAPVAATLPNGATLGFGAGTMLSIANLGAGTVTITCSSCTINGAATLPLAQNQGADIYGGSGTPQVNYVALSSPSGTNFATLSGNNIFAGNNSFNNINSIRFADQFAGADCGAKINAAAAGAGQTVIVNTNCGATITTALNLPTNTTLTFLDGLWQWNTPNAVSNPQINIGGNGWGNTFFTFGFASGDLYTVTGGTFRLHDISFQAAVLRTSGAIVNIQASGGKVSDLYITDPFRAFTSNTCSVGQWTFDNIRVQSGGGNWDSFINGGLCSGTALINSYTFNNINGNTVGAAAVSAPFILLDTGVDTWQFSNSDITSGNSSTLPLVELIKTGTGSPARNVHFVNSNFECGTGCAGLQVFNALDTRFVIGNLSSGLRGCIISGGVGTHIINTQFVNDQDEGCIVNNVAALDTQFISNHFSDNSQSSAGGFPHITITAGVTNFVASFNEFDNKYLGTGTFASSGINVLAGASDNYRIVGNRCDLTALTSTCLSNLGTGSNQYIAGNQPAAPPALTGTGACATFSTQVGQLQTGKFTCTAATAGSTITITFTGVAAPNGWNCVVQDQTTRANLIQQTSSNTTSCTLTATSVTQNDVMALTSANLF